MQAPLPFKATFPFISSGLTLGALALLGALSGCASRPSMRPILLPVPYVDLDRYMGRWYVIAHIPYFLERGKVASFDTYAKRPDGKLDTTFTFRRGSLTAPETSWHATAKIENSATNAEWSVQPIWPLSTDYVVIDLDPDYRWAVVGHPSRKVLWVLARDRQLPDDVFAAIARRTAAQGYDPARLVKIPQPAN